MWNNRHKWALQKWDEKNKGKQSQLFLEVWEGQKDGNSIVSFSQEGSALELMLCELEYREKIQPLEMTHIIFIIM